MLDTETSFGFGNVFCAAENEFHENGSKVYFAFKIAEKIKRFIIVPTCKLYCFVLNYSMYFLQL